MGQLLNSCDDKLVVPQHDGEEPDMDLPRIEWRATVFYVSDVSEMDLPCVPSTQTARFSGDAARQRRLFEKAKAPQCHSRGSAADLPAMPSTHFRQLSGPLGGFH